VVLETVGTLGTDGTALIVIVDAACVEQVLSAVLRTLKVYVLGAKLEKVALA
jgi:hypothetical protein